MTPSSQPHPTPTPLTANSATLITKKRRENNQPQIRVPRNNHPQKKSAPSFRPERHEINVSLMLVIHFYGRRLLNQERQPLPGRQVLGNGGLYLHRY
jgi:hypothetical protein